MRFCLVGSYLCVPGGKLGCLKGQIKSTLISTDASTLRPTGHVGGRDMPPRPFGLGAYRSLVVWSYSCRACAGSPLTTCPPTRFPHKRWRRLREFLIVTVACGVTGRVWLSLPFLVQLTCLNQWASRPKTWPQGGATWHMHSSKGLPQWGLSVTNVDCFLVLMKLASYRSGATETTDWVLWNSLCCCVRASNSSSLVHYTVTSAIIHLQVFKITMPGGTHCCVPRCINRGYSHRWPCDKERSKAWEIAVQAVSSRGHPVLSAKRIFRLTAMFQWATTVSN